MGLALLTEVTIRCINEVTTYSKAFDCMQTPWLPKLRSNGDNYFAVSVYLNDGHFDELDVQLEDAIIETILYWKNNHQNAKRKRRSELDNCIML
jgi:hypothetical protein